jgi:hypothetical protein
MEDDVWEKYREAMMEQNAWLEDVLAGLLINGVTKDEIEVRRFQDNPLKVVVAVRGVPKYEHTIKLTYTPG